MTRHLGLFALVICSLSCSRGVPTSRSVQLLVDCPSARLAVFRAVSLSLVTLGQACSIFYSAINVFSKKQELGCLMCWKSATFDLCSRDNGPQRSTPKCLLIEAQPASSTLTTIKQPIFRISPASKYPWRSVVTTTGGCSFLPLVAAPL